MAIIQGPVSRIQQEQFVRKLQEVGPDLPGCSTHAREYLQHLIRHAPYYTQIAAFHLNLLGSQLAIPWSTVRLVDFGAGNGLMGLLAVYSGAGSVVVQDINPEFTHAAQVLARQLSLYPEAFITGDERQLQEWCSQQNWNPHGLVSFDVIEHVYDLDQLFHCFRELNPQLQLIMGTGVNAHHPLKRRAFMKMQQTDEWNGGSSVDRSLYGPSSSAFRDIRRNILQQHWPEITPAQLEEWVSRTRGMHRGDIIRAITRYQENKLLPEPPDHPTNTCDPVTGSWTERLLTLQEYRTILQRHQYRMEVTDGFYNDGEGGIRSVFLKLLNAALPFFRHRLSPFLVFQIRPV